LLDWQPISHVHNLGYSTHNKTKNVIVVSKITLIIYDCHLHGNNATGTHSGVDDLGLLWFDTVSTGYYLQSFYRGVFCLHLQGPSTRSSRRNETTWALKMEAVSCDELSVDIYHLTQCHIPGDLNLKLHNYVDGRFVKI
jgi:hypothetical protein